MVKLKDLLCSVIKLDGNGNAYADHFVKLGDSPWIPYLKDKNTEKLYQSFEATRKHPDHPDDYHYPLYTFDKLVDSIRKNGYKNEFCNNENFQNDFNGKNWPGGKGAVKIGGNKIGDGHHRCAILYHIYGPDYEVNVVNNILQNIEPIPRFNNIGIIIVWPKHKEFKTTIENELLSQNYEIQETKELTVSKNYITNLLREIHYKKPWWDIHLENEVNKRIGNDNDAQLHYYIVKLNNIHEKFKDFKRTIREKYKIDKSYFHLCDPDCFNHLGLNCSCPCNLDQFINETKKHLDMLSNKNTIHFLTHADFKKEFNFNIYFEKYSIALNNSPLNKEEFCIDNGGILAAYGLRDAHDLDFISNYENIHVNDSDIGCENKNHREEYSRLGYSIRDIIDNPINHFYHFNKKFMALHILKKFKYNRTHTVGVGQQVIRKKDINDYKLIETVLMN